MTEDVIPIPKNVYGVTKIAAESLCEMFYRKYGLSSIVLRTSRFFPEADDNPAIREHYAQDNVQANEMLYRRVDIEDVVSAHVLAIEKAARLGFGRYIISATTPFGMNDLVALRSEAGDVVRRLFPDCEAVYSAGDGNCFQASTGSTSINGRGRSLDGGRNMTFSTCWRAHERLRIFGVRWHAWWAAKGITRPCLQRARTR